MATPEPCQGRPWIVLELINGRSLAEAIREHGLLTEQRTAEFGLYILDALRTAHREGIVHRDVKPANILIDDADRVVLTDFGIAAIDDATALTATGQTVGSPAYLAPERINGRPATAAADLWALGVTLYTAVTGRSPFQREDTQATIAAVLTSRPTSPAHARRLWPVIKALLVKDPAHHPSRSGHPCRTIRPSPAAGESPSGGLDQQEVSWDTGRSPRGRALREHTKARSISPSARPASWPAPTPGPYGSGRPPPASW